MSLILDALRRADRERERDRGGVPSLHTQMAPTWSPAGEPAQGDSTPRPWLWLAAGLGGGLGLAAVWALWSATPGAVTAEPPVAPPPVPGAVAQAPDSIPPPGPAPAMPPAPQTAATPTAAAPDRVMPPPPDRTAPAPAPAPQAKSPPPPEPTKADPRPAPAARAQADPPAPLPARAPSADRKPPQRDEPQAARASPPPRRDDAKPEPPPAPERPAAAPIRQLGELPADVRSQLPALTIGGAMYSSKAASRRLIVNGQLLSEGDQVAPGLVLEEIRLKSAVLRWRDLRYEQGF